MRELHESAKQILIKQRNKDILREAFLYDVRRLEEARALSQTLLSEGVIEQKIEDQYLLDEGIFDTIKALGKNVGGAALNKAKEVGGAALNKAKAEWDKAKEQGNQAELARLQARMAQLQGKAAPAPAASAAATKRKPVLPTKAAPAPAPTKTPPVLPTKAAPAPAPTKTPPVLPTKAAPAPAIPNKKVPMAPAAPSGEDKAILNKAAEEIVVQMAQNDPQKFQTLIGKSPAELQKMLASPQVEKEQDKAEAELATDPAAQKKPGFLGKLWTKTKAIAKKHPILFWGGLGLFAATVGAAAVGAGGAGALLASIVAKVAASKATIATAGLMKGTMAAGKEFITQKRAGGKMDYKKILKVGGKEAAKGAAYTTAAVAGGSLLGHAATGVSKIASGIGNSMSGLFGAKGAADMKASADAPASAANATSGAAPTVTTNVNGIEYKSHINPNGNIDDALKNISKVAPGDRHAEGIAKFGVEYISSGKGIGAQYPNLHNLIANANDSGNTKYALRQILSDYNPADQEAMLKILEKDPSGILKLAKASGPSGDYQWGETFNNALAKTVNK